jgi:flagellar basal-body rod protein FlgB
MATILTNITDRTTMQVLEKSLAFGEARLRVIAENVANLHTPGFRAKQLDPGTFQTALRKAVDTRKKNPGGRFVVESGRNVRTDANGSLTLTPSYKKADNLLFHDGTNFSIEREMAELAETGLAHDVASTLLKGKWDGLRKAIRGTVG